MNYVIRNESETEELLFWSNEEGWTDLGSATQFTEEEKQRFNHLPIDGTWVQYPPKNIYKHVITVTVLSDKPTPEETFGEDWDLYEVYNAVHFGDCLGACIGDFDHELSQIVPEEEVKKELIALGDDGTFFDY